MPDGDVLVGRSTRRRCASACAALRDAGVEAVAVCLLHSYLNPTHERRIKEIVLEEFPEATSPSRTRCCRSTASSSASRPSA